jgi:hypothetical protein
MKQIENRSFPSSFYALVAESIVVSAYFLGSCKLQISGILNFCNYFCSCDSIYGALTNLLFKLLGLSTKTFCHQLLNLITFFTFDLT